MKIRCNNCYRVLNNDEEWCTRCGTHSDIIEKNLKEGIVPIAEDEIGKRSLLFYFLIAFLLTGILDVLFGVIFNNIHDGYDYGAVGQVLPIEISYFSAVNALLFSSIIMMAVAFLVNIKDFKEYFRFELDKRTYLSIVIGIIVIVGIVFLHKYTAVCVVPKFFKDFLVEPTNGMLIEGSISLFKILVILLAHAFIEEVVFRKAFINWLDQTTIMADGLIICLQSIVSTVLSTACLLLLVQTTFMNSLICIISNLGFQIILGLNYFYTRRNIVVNLLLRVLFIILLVIIL